MNDALQIENKKYYKLGKRTFILLIMQRSILAIFILILAVLINSIVPKFLPSLGLMNYASILNSITTMGVFLAIIVESFGIIAALLEYSVSRVMLDDLSLKIFKGMLSKKLTEIPYRRIQDIEIKQTLFQRLFGVGHLVISTTTNLNQPNQNENESNTETIYLMDYPLAYALSDILTDRAEIEKMEVERKTST